MTIQAIAFDLGNTLVEYYQREAFPSILSDAIRNAHAVLSSFSAVELEEAQALALTENNDQSDAKVRPLQERFDKVFGLSERIPADARERAARAFLRPIFECARKYRDTGPALQILRAQGYKLAIVSNTPWGSPSEPWREELRRLDLANAIDLSIFCVDVGWRKPSRMIFNRVLQALNVKAAECLFVGDEPVWDIEGARAAGMPAVLIDRTNRQAARKGPRVQSLEEIATLIELAFSSGAG